MSDRPYLSVVATARNDDHGGNPLYRTQLFVDGLVAQAERFRLPTELVLVEWNPPDDRPRLAEVLAWPKGDGFCDVRIIEVPHELHATLEYSDRLPLFQMIGKNVGIRRARGELVLATNIDILFSDGLMRYLAAKEPRHGYVYTADRFDVPAEIDPDWPIERQLAFADANAIRIHRREGTLDLRDGVFYRVYPEIALRSSVRNSRLGPWLVRSRVARLTGLRWLLLGQPVPHRGLDRLFDSRFGGIVDLGRVVQRRLARRFARERIRRFFFRIYAFAYWFVAGFNEPRKVPQRALRLLSRVQAPGTLDDQTRAARATQPSLSRRIAAAALLPLKLARGVAWLLRARWHDTRDWVADDVARIRLHTNASGDFTLMAKSDWLKTGGYAEFQMYSMHIDGLQLYLAHYNGIEERFLPFAIYHIEHGGGFRPEARGDDALDATLARRAIPQISNDKLLDYIRTMYANQAPLRPNGPDWGFADVTLPETRPQRSRELTPVTTRGNR